MEVPMWYSVLRIWHGHSCGTGCNCGTGSLPGLGTSTFCRCNEKKKKKDTLIRGENTSSVISLPHVPSSLGRRFTEL